MNSASLVADLMNALSPGVVENLAQPVAHTLVTTISPTLLLIGLYVRLLEAQASTVMGVGRFSQALRDIFVWGTVLVVYFAAGGLVTGYLNALYALMARIGSLHTVARQMAALLTTAAQRPHGVLADVEDVNTLPLQIATVFIYYLTLVLTALLESLLRIAETIGFEFAFLYGLIAIPLALSSTFSLLRGWARLMGFFILWPVVESLLLAVFAPVFTQAVASLQQYLGPSDYMIVYAHMLFSILNLIICAVLIAAPYITGALVENAGGAQPLLAPYMGALATAGATLAAGVDRGVAATVASWPEMRAPLAVAPRPMPVIRVPSDPDYVDGLAMEIPRTNYLDPQFDKPPPPAADDEA
ncbi:MAG: hypothetical protein ACYCXG_06670 [Acidiferrobacter sp.]